MTKNSGVFKFIECTLIGAFVILILFLVLTVSFNFGKFVGEYETLNKIKSNPEWLEKWKEQDEMYKRHREESQKIYKEIKELESEDE